MSPTTPLPCDGDGLCMVCKSKPSDAEVLTCKTCATPWHVDCLSTPPSSMSDAALWECPDCSLSDPASTAFAVSREAGPAAELIASIRAIEADATLSDVDKARKRQELLTGDVCRRGSDVATGNEILEILGDNIKCSFCMQLPDRPVTTPCGHNFCLKCFEKWVGQGKKSCAKCRKAIPASMASQPRINASLVFAIRAARTQKRTQSSTDAAATKEPRVFDFIDNADLPDEAFTTERAVKAGKANARSGKIFVTIPADHLGPITAEYDPIRNTGLLVGDSWTDRLACRQWGAHFPHVSGIAGQSLHGAQSVVLSGGYEDDEDHGEWFIYTGSGGRDLSGNKRTNKEQSFDQKFTGANEALRLSCLKGYPVRVVRSFKEKRSNFAPEIGVRYDGIYRIEKCWLKLREQEKDGERYKVCRYLFVRCDNSPAPWTSDELGDRPRSLPKVPELKKATELTERKETAHWDFDELEGCWKWIKPQPPSKKPKPMGGAVGGGGGSIVLGRIVVGGGPIVKKTSKAKSSKAKILKEFRCLICRKVLTLPITTPCAHNFCKACLDGAFEGQKFVRERQTGGRQLRTQKSVMKCPSCPTDISGFLQNAEVNRELMGVIESLMRKFEEEEKEAAAACREDEKDVTEEEDATQGEEETVVSDSTETEAIPIENTDDVDKSEPVSASTRGPERKTAVHVESVETRGACQEEEEDEHEDKDATEVEIKNIVSDSTETETIPMKNTDVVEKSEPVPATKRGRKRKNDVSVAPVKTRGRKDKKACQEEEEYENDEKDATQDDEENVVSDPTETEAIPTECTDDVDKSEPVLAAKRGRKRKNAATALVAPAKTSGRKAKKACGEKEEDEHGDKDAAQEGEENLVSDSTETKVVPIENTDDVEESEPVPAAKRGHKRENAALASAPVAPARTRGRKAKEAVDDGNDSPSCPLHVPADN